MEFGALELIGSFWMLELIGSFGVLELIGSFWLLPTLPKAKADLGIAFSVHLSVRTSVPARQYLLCVICNSNSFQSILFKLCTVFVYTVLEIAGIIQ